MTKKRGFAMGLIPEAERPVSKRQEVGSKPEVEGRRVEQSAPESVDVDATIESSTTSSDKTDIEPAGSDFFDVNADRLGYKSRLNLVLRSALKRLESQVSRDAGLPVDQLRKSFTIRRVPLIANERDWPIAREYVLEDYRTFLILLIMLAQRRPSIL
jgi:hypothetical protein